MKKYTDEEFIEKITEHIKKFSIRIGERVDYVRQDLTDYLTEMSKREKKFTFEINEVSSRLCKIIIKLDKEYNINYSIN